MNLSQLRPYAAAVLVMSLATLLAWLLQPYVSLPNLVLLFVLAVVVVAFFFGNRPSILAAILASAAYGLLYVPWMHTHWSESGQYVLTALITIALSLLISQLVVRWRNVALELDRLNRYARELETERLRNSVLSALSHDLRTPLASMVGASSTLAAADMPLLPAQRQALAELIYDESRRMQALVENLLDMARLESGPVALQRDWQALEEILGTQLQQWRQRLAPRQLSLRLPPELPLLRCDPRLIERVVANLLENCGKYTPPETHIVMRVTVNEAAVVLVVEDDGPGLGEDPDLLFRKFCRGDNAAEQSGAGLGLAICRSIMEAHGGRILAENRSPHGARFIVSLPRSAGDLQLLPDEEEEGA